MFSKIKEKIKDLESKNRMNEHDIRKIKDEMTRLQGRVNFHVNEAQHMQKALGLKYIREEVIPAHFVKEDHNEEL